MRLLYSNNGLSYRDATPHVVDPRDLDEQGNPPSGFLPSDPIEPSAGEIAFDHAPTTDELRAAFPGYDVAVTAQQNPVPEEISDRQFFQAIAMAGLITNEEALAAVKTGAIPATLQSVIGALPTEQRFPAEMLISGAVTFQRHHAMVAALQSALQKTDAELDDIWRAAAAL